MRRLLRIAGWAVGAIMVVAGLIGLAVWRELTMDLPTVSELLDYRPPTATRVLAADGTPIGEFYVERRYLVPIDDVPPRVRSAFLAAEDAGFYRHRGIDLMGIGRAVVANYRQGEIVQGASTITQQVVKQLLLSSERSFERKGKEMILALQIESKLTKDQIFYLYLNHIFFGAGCYGIAAAARQFFDVDPAGLSVAQAALLAGLPQAPSRYDPIRHPAAARARQRYVLGRMRAAGFIDQDEYETARAEPISIAGGSPSVWDAAPWYAEYVRTLLEKEYGSAFATLGLQVHTAVDLRLQRIADEVLDDGLRTVERELGRQRTVRHLAAAEIDDFLERQRGSRPGQGPWQAVVTAAAKEGLRIRTPWEQGILPGITTGFHPGDVVWVEPAAGGAGDVRQFTLDTKPQIEGALVAIDPETAEVKALAGGVDFRRSQFNRAVQARRQPGSAFKPFIYAAALEHGYTPATIVTDAPISLPDGRRGLWTPRNFKDRYMGMVPLRTALTNSLNSVSVRLALDIGIDPLRQYLRAFGFPSDFPRNFSLALGSSEVTLLDLTRAYGVFATLGRRFEPRFVTSVSDSGGRSVDFTGSHPRFERVLKPATAFVVTDMMRDVIELGTGQAAKKLGRPAAGKTGTTNEAMDAWFVGFTPELLVGVWVGFDAERSLGALTGGRAAAPIWTQFMLRALEGRPVRDFAPPEDVTFVQVDLQTGLLAVAGRTSRLEAFVAGSEPTRKAALAPEPDVAASQLAGGTAPRDSME